MANKKSISGEVIKLRNVRLSFPNLHEASSPKNMPDAKKSFGASFLLDPKNATHVAIIKEVQAEIARLRKEAWGGPHPKEEKLICFGKGDTRINDDGAVYNGYEGMYFVTARSAEDKRPLIIDRQKNVVSDPKAINQMLYGGCFVNANVNFWIQDNAAGKAVRCGLQAVQFWADGEAFGGGRASVDDFDDVEEPDGLDGLDDDDLGL
jgi:hypothetical protein